MPVFTLIYESEQYFFSRLLEYTENIKPRGFRKMLGELDGLVLYRILNVDVA